MPNGFWVEFIGYMAASLTTISFLPQAVKTIRTGDTSAISLAMYSIFCTGVFLWLVYGLALNNWPMTLANSVTLVLAGVIWFIKWRHRRVGLS
ncbi:MAG: SemiSWEET transporter [Aestuariibacter sp.]